MTASGIFDFEQRDVAPARGWDSFPRTDEFGNPATNSGTTVTEETSLKYSAVWAAVGLIVDSIAPLSPKAVKENDDGSLTKVNLPAWVRSPHPELRRPEVLSVLLTSALLWGNGYALIARNGSGSPSALLPLDPRRVYCDWVDPVARQHRFYQIDGGVRLGPNDVFHLQGLTLPGCATGLSPIAQAREAIGLGLTLEEFGARYFKQGSMSKVVLELPGQLTEEQARAIVANYERFHKGAGNWHRPAVASGGSAVKPISIPPEDAQFLESREFQALDVARWYRVPPHRIGIISKQSSWGSGLAEENTAMTQMTFRPWIQRLESAFTYYTAGPEDRGVLIKLDDSDLMKGSFEDTIKTWSTAVLGGWVRPNEARKAIGLEPIPEGDGLLVPLAPSGPAIKDPPPGQVITNGSKPTTQHDPQGQDNTNHSAASSTPAQPKTGGGPNGKAN